MKSTIFAFSLIALLGCSSTQNVKINQHEQSAKDIIKNTQNLKEGPTLNDIKFACENAYKSAYQLKDTAKLDTSIKPKRFPKRIAMVDMKDGIYSTPEQTEFEIPVFPVRWGCKVNFEDNKSGLIYPNRKQLFFKTSKGWEYKDQF
jgi:hypothetical protein